VSVRKGQRVEVQRFLGRRKRSLSDHGSTLARPSGRGPDCCPGLSLFIWAGSAQARVVAAPPAGPSNAGKRVHWGPRVYEPDTMC